jgi:hypothetical protein
MKTYKQLNNNSTQKAKITYADESEGTSLITNIKLYKPSI